MTIAEVFNPGGDAPSMIDSMYDLLIAARIHFGVAELRGGEQLFVLPLKPGAAVREDEVLWELAAWLSSNGHSFNEMSNEINNAMIDII